LLLARRIADSVGGFGDHWNVLASAACVLGGDLLARYDHRLRGQCNQKPDVSLHIHRAAISDSRDSVPFV